MLRQILTQQSLTQIKIQIENPTPIKKIIIRMRIENLIQIKIKIKSQILIRVQTINLNIIITPIKRMQSQIISHLSLIIAKIVTLKTEERTLQLSMM